MNTKKTAVVLFQLGGPDSLDAVEPFIYNYFATRTLSIFPERFFSGNPCENNFIAARPKGSRIVQEYRRSISHSSQTMAQAKGLRASLKARELLPTSMSPCVTGTR